MRIYETGAWCSDHYLKDLTGKEVDHHFRDTAIDLEKVCSVRRRKQEDDDPDIIEDGITIVYTVDGESFILKDKYEDFIKTWKKHYYGVIMEGHL